MELMSLTQQELLDYQRPASELATAIRAVPEKLRDSLIGVIEEALPSLPTVSDTFRTARESSGSPSSAIEKAYGSTFEALANQAGELLNLRAQGLREHGHANPQGPAARVLGVISNIERVGREHIELAIEQVKAG
jgi:hypothetical protein